MIGEINSRDFLQKVHVMVYFITHYCRPVDKKKKAILFDNKSLGSLDLPDFGFVDSDFHKRQVAKLKAIAMVRRINPVRYIAKVIHPVYSFYDFKRGKNIFVRTIDGKIISES